MGGSRQTLGRGAAWLLLGPVLAIIFVGYVLPGLALLAMSLEVPFRWPTVFDAFTFRHYERLLTDIYYARILGYTLAMGAIVSAITAIAAFPIAYYLARTRSRLTSLC